jgi:hypothetical protein
VFECCKGETPDVSGELFVLSNHLCFRKDAGTFEMSPHGFSKAHRTLPSPSKFAVPMASIRDARIHPGVYPFGAILVAIDGLAKPWTFSFFTEREAAIKCIRSARGYRGRGGTDTAAWTERHRDGSPGPGPGGSTGGSGGGWLGRGGGGGFLRWFSRRGWRNAKRCPDNDDVERVNLPRGGVARWGRGGGGGVGGVLLGVGGLVLAAAAGAARGGAGPADSKRASEARRKADGAEKAAEAKKKAAEEVSTKASRAEKSELAKSGAALRRLKK